MVRKTFLRDNAEHRCSQSKPPRTTRLADAGIIVRQTQISPPVSDNSSTQDKENFAAISADSSLLQPRISDLNKVNEHRLRPMSSMESQLNNFSGQCAMTSDVAVPALQIGIEDEITAIIKPLSVAHNDSSDTLVKLKSVRRSFRLPSEGAQDDAPFSDNHRLDWAALPTDSKEKGTVIQQEENEDNNDFDLRILKRNVNMDQSCDDLEKEIRNISGINCNKSRSIGKGSQSQPSPSSSLMSEMVNVGRWHVSQRVHEQNEANSGLDTSGTCVDTKGELIADFIDGVKFMRRLTEYQDELEKDKQPQKPSCETRRSVVADMLDTPARTISAETENSPNSRRESVIAIRVSRAGFVRRNVREIENTFATPTGEALRTRQHTPITNSSNK
ncbi:hypothetical protein BIW11_03339 [Tropilaelaps mercedesae]|uniref:Uncharacterized protein n=1 Tax=Tropilaelaps mercedesae TaxID=418985 RepID=A0A1V9XND5_9ACAR|nr:hypothetical protein BIW11_03339 [Tropilaelaps mercedesae]